MKVFYDSHTDTLSVILKDNVAIHESDEDKPGVILDYDKEGNLISPPSCSEYDSDRIVFQESQDGKRKNKSQEIEWRCSDCGRPGFQSGCIVVMTFGVLPRGVYAGLSVASGEP